MTNRNARTLRRLSLVLLPFVALILQACGGGNAPNTTPEPFTFQEVSGADLNTVVRSNSITVTGITAPAPITASSGATLIIDGKASPADTVTNNQTVAVELRSANTHATKTSTAVTIGGVSSTFTVTTKDKPASTPEPEPEPAKPVDVQTTLPEDEPGTVGEEYEFTFVYDSNAATSSSMNVFNLGNEVVFRWAWGDGTGDDAIVTVDADGFAYLEVKHAYSASGLHGIVVTVEEPETSEGEPGAQLARFDYVVQIGEVLETESFVLQCDGSPHPENRYRGERGVHHHVWDISNAPTGATIDMWFDTYGQPDKYIVEYPAGQMAHDTGWRGNEAHYNNKPELYPGGLSGPREGIVEGMVTKLAEHNSLEMTIIGPDKGTIWFYTLTCNS